MSELNKNKIGFLVALINEFGQRFGLSTADSYRYINKYGGVQMFLEHYDILHTLSFRDMVDGVAAYCKRQGGSLEWFQYAFCTTKAIEQLVKLWHLQRDNSNIC